MNVMRAKEKIIEDIRKLVKTKGYIYALCMIIIEDFHFNLVEIHKANVRSRMGHNEVSLLLGFLIQNEIDFSSPDKLQDLMGLKRTTYELMEELQHSLMDPFSEKILEKLQTIGNESREPDDGRAETLFGEIFSSGPELITEATFYSGTGLYDLQFLEFLERKYKYDKEWLHKRGLDLEKSKNIAIRIKEILLRKAQKVIFLGSKEELSEIVEKAKKEYPNESGDEEQYAEYMAQMLELYQYDILLKNALGNKKEFGREELESFCKSLMELFVIRKADFDKDLDVDLFFKNFSLVAKKGQNDTLQSIGNANLLHDKPIIKLDEEKFFVPVSFAVFRAIYETPFYWMLEDTSYKAQADRNRGVVGEEITYELLSKVFGESRTFKSVKIKKGKKNTRTDIDVLCILGNKALCVQVKSKKLTLSSRSGNSEKLKEDFKKAIQKAYEQGLISRQEILSSDSNKSVFYDENGREITLPGNIDEVYIMGVTTEDYPSLAIQSKVMLDKKGDEPYPVFLTIFDLDLVTHYLNDPYDFLHYIRQRISLMNFFSAGEEIIYLGYHLTENLSKPPDSANVRLVSLNVDFGQLVDRNYYPFKAGIETLDEGDAIKNRWKNEDFAKLCNTLKSLDRPETTDMIFHLLDMDYEYRDKLVDRIIKTKRKTLGDGKYHSFLIMPPSLGDGFSKVGIAYFSESSNDSTKLRRRLSDLCQAAKYRSKSDVWIGIGSLKNSDEIFDEMVFYSQKWKPDPSLEKLSNTVLITPAQEALDGRLK